LIKRRVRALLLMNSRWPLASAVALPTFDQGIGPVRVLAASMM